MPVLAFFVLSVLFLIIHVLGVVHIDTHTFVFSPEILCPGCGAHDRHILLSTRVLDVVRKTHTHTLVAFSSQPIVLSPRHKIVHDRCILSFSVF